MKLLSRTAGLYDHVVIAVKFSFDRFHAYLVEASVAIGHVLIFWRSRLTTLRCIANSSLIRWPVGSSMNLRRNRCRHDIIRGILLLLCESPLRYTHIMQKAKLSTDMTDDYIRFLLQRQWIVQTEKNWFRVSGKGREYLQLAENLCQC